VPEVVWLEAAVARFGSLEVTSRCALEESLVACVLETDALGEAVLDVLEVIVLEVSVMAVAPVSTGGTSAPISLCSMVEGSEVIGWAG
jgi:hypothetical protein